MRFKARWWLVGSMAMMLLVAACGGEGTPPPAAAREIQVTAGDFFFTPSEFTLGVGETVRFVITNEGTVDHTFTIVLDGQERGIDLPVGAQGEIFDFTASQAGTFQVVCTLPGHKELGMVGTLVVE